MELKPTTHSGDTETALESDFSAIRPGEQAWRETSASDQTAAGCAVDVWHFRTFGFVVLRQFFDPVALATEIDHVMQTGLVPSPDDSCDGEIRFQYVPMMSRETPASLALLDRAEVVAAAVLGGAVLPTRAKGVRYSGDTPWHADSNLPVASIGFAAYLEPLGAESGALRVLPGSHRSEFAEALRVFGADGMVATSLPSCPVPTQPGDMILFDEHLFHSSFGGGIRRQWRADYVPDPADAEAKRHTISYFESIYPPDWDGGYDVDRYASYGPDWLRSGRASVARLGALGVYELARRQEAFARSKR